MDIPHLAKHTLYLVPPTLKVKSNRRISATNVNEESNRSHTIFTTIESREHVEGEEQLGCVNVSQLNLVDLAGSERARQTGATGIRFKEGTIINKSLFSLAMVINQLAEGTKKYVNYRDSKLTRILQSSLGGNAKTSIICAITPTAVDETISTLHPTQQGAPESSELYPPRNIKPASELVESVAGPTTSPLPTTNEMVEIDSEADEDAVPCSPHDATADR